VVGTDTGEDRQDDVRTEDAGVATAQMIDHAVAAASKQMPNVTKSS